MNAVHKYIRISPKKLRLVVDLVRGKSVNEAMLDLRFMPKKAAPIVAKCIKSAAANAENNFKLDKNKLSIKEIRVAEGPTLKRGRPCARGRWHRILKRTSHLYVKLS